jgi:hypothetical protein
VLAAAMQITDGAGEVDGGAEHRTHNDHVTATGLGGLNIEWKQ